MSKRTILTQIATDLGTTLPELQTKMNSATLTEINEFTDYLMNKIGKQLLINTFNYKNPITSIFAKDAFQYGDGAEILDVQLGTDPADYDPSKYVPTNNQQQIMLSELIKTIDKKVFEAEVNSSIIRGALLSDSALTGMIEKLVGAMDKNLEIFLLNTLTKALKDGVKNTKALNGKLLEN